MTFLEQIEAFRSEFAMIQDDLVVMKVALALILVLCLFNTYSSVILLVRKNNDK